MTGLARRVDAAEDVLVRLEALRDVTRAASEATGAAVAAARAAGVSWQRVGDALGVSRQAASQRFGARQLSPGRATDAAKEGAATARESGRSTPRRTSTAEARLSRVWSVWAAVGVTRRAVRLAGRRR